jgi:hypothetical protein
MSESQTKSPLRRSGRPALVEWVTVAERARKALVGIANPTSRELEPAAKAAGLKSATLMRYIGLLEFIERLQQEPRGAAVAAGLRDARVAGVALIMRWHRYDRAGALAAAQKLIAGDLTIEQLIEAERRSHASTDQFVSTRSYRHQLRERLTPWLNRVLGGDFEPGKVSPDDPPVDLLFRTKTKPQRRVGALILDRFPSRHRATKVSAFLTTLAGASLMLEHVVGFVPKSPDEDQYKRWFASNNLDRSNISLFWIPAGSYPDRDPEPLQGFFWLAARGRF